MKIHIETVTTDLTPEMVAEEFWGMNDEEQCRFFNHLGDTAGSLLAMQLQFVTDNKILNSDGRYIMRLIGEYSDPSNE